MTTELPAAEAWLVAAAGDAVPAALLDRMRVAVRAAPGGGSVHGVAGDLAAAAMCCLQDALQRCDQRDAALPLLAADALMTAACEAAAQEGAGRLHALCEEYDVARLAARVDDVAGAGA